MSGGYRALEELRRSGAVACIGLGVNEREVCLAALDHGDWDVFLLAGRYTLLEQAPIEDLFPACKRAKTSLIVGGPFNSGILVGGGTWNCEPAPPEIVERTRRLEAVCDSHGVPLSAAAIQFPLSSPLVASVIPGPRSAAQARQITDWYSVDIPASLWSDLRTEGLLHPAAPIPAP
jgi:D-threo-aldose 1-dehydrogenase